VTLQVTSASQLSVPKMQSAKSDILSVQSESKLVCHYDRECPPNAMHSFDTDKCPVICTGRFNSFQYSI